MKGMFIILDGVGDLPIKQFSGKTPLEEARTPNLDYLAERSQMGIMYTVEKGFTPGSDEAIISIFGNSLSECSRGQLEAYGTNIKIKDGDLAFRTNFATIDSWKKGNISDRRSGRTLSTKEAEQLSKTINEIEFEVPFEFVATVQHRGVLVFRGKFSDKITGNDETYSGARSIPATKVIPCKALNKSSFDTANMINLFLRKVHEALDNHPVNEARHKKGFLKANYLLVRGPGSRKPKLKQYKKWMSIGYMPLEKGFSRLSGMSVFEFDYPPLKHADSYENLWDALKKAVKFSVKTLKKQKNNFDYAYIHLKETDLPGHDNKPYEKKAMIEYLDKKFFKFIRKFAVKNDIKVVATADHSTPCILKNHSADPVPVMEYHNFEVLSGQRFCEKDAKLGNLGVFLGKDFMKKVGLDK